MNNVIEVTQDETLICLHESGEDEVVEIAPEIVQLQAVIEKRSAWN